MSLLVDIGTLLDEINSNIYYGDRPDTPNNCLVLYHTGGQPAVHSIGTQPSTLEKPTFQVEIRNESATAALSQAYEVKDILDGLTKQVINYANYEAIFLQGDIFPLGKDDRERTSVTVNFVAWVKRYRWVLSAFATSGKWIDSEVWVDTNTWKD